MFQSDTEPEREAREAVVRGGQVRDTQAARQKRPKAFDFLDDLLTREVCVKLVQRDVSQRVAQQL